jgi:hypothetical protein
MPAAALTLHSILSGRGRGKKSSLAQNVTFITSRNSNFWHNLFGLKIAPAIFKSALLPRRSCGGAFFSSNHAIIWKAHES